MLVEIYDCEKYYKVDKRGQMHKFTYGTAQNLTANAFKKEYTVTYNANGGSCSTATKSLTFGDSYGTLPTPTRTHYTFDGWYNGDYVLDAEDFVVATFELTKEVKVK